MTGNWRLAEAAPPLPLDPIPCTINLMTGCKGPYLPPSLPKVPPAPSDPLHRLADGWMTSWLNLWRAMGGGLITPARPQIPYTINLMAGCKGPYLPPYAKALEKVLLPREYKVSLT